MNTYILSVTTKPTRKELQQYITPKYATIWSKIGRKLDLSDETLGKIKQNNTDVRKCCREMFSEWLDVDTGASWQKLFTVIDNCAGEYFSNIAIVEPLATNRHSE